VHYPLVTLDTSGFDIAIPTNYNKFKRSLSNAQVNQDHDSIMGTRSSPTAVASHVNNATHRTESRSEQLEQGHFYHVYFGAHCKGTYDRASMKKNVGECRSHVAFKCPYQVDEKNGDQFGAKRDSLNRLGLAICIIYYSGLTLTLLFYSFFGWINLTFRRPAAWYHHDMDSDEQRRYIKYRMCFPLIAFVVQMIASVMITSFATGVTNSINEYGNGTVKAYGPGKTLAFPWIADFLLLGSSLFEWYKRGALQRWWRDIVRGRGRV
jgi:hypothetical protein